MSYQPLTDEQWEKVAFLIPEQEMGRPRTRDREILDAILYILYNGCPWGALPASFPPRATVHRRFKVWSKAGFFKKVLRELKKSLPEQDIYYLDSSLAMAKKGATKWARPCIAPEAARSR